MKPRVKRELYREDVINCRSESTEFEDTEATEERDQHGGTENAETTRRNQQG